MGDSRYLVFARPSRRLEPDTKRYLFDSCCFEALSNPCPRLTAPPTPRSNAMKSSAKRKCHPVRPVRAVSRSWCCSQRLNVIDIISAVIEVLESGKRPFRELVQLESYQLSYSGITTLARYLHGGSYQGPSGPACHAHNCASRVCTCFTFFISWELHSFISPFACCCCHQLFVNLCACISSAFLNTEHPDILCRVPLCMYTNKRGFVSPPHFFHSSLT